MSQLATALFLLSTLTSTGATRQLPYAPREALLQPPTPPKQPGDGGKGGDKKGDKKDEEDEEEDIFRR